jgi:hypothetical protein
MECASREGDRALCPACKPHVFPHGEWVCFWSLFLESSPGLGVDMYRRVKVN